MGLNKMGRKRISRGKAREPVTISLPRDLVIRFDETLGERTRSRTIEWLIKRWLETSQTKLNTAYGSLIGRHHYHCMTCHREFTLSRMVEPILMVCRGSAGCGSDKIEYVGHLIEEGEEEE